MDSNEPQLRLADYTPAMTNAWITLIIAGLLEVVWAIGIKYTDGFNFRTRTMASILTLLAMIASMYLLAQAIRTIPVGTGYAIWTGIGALGAAALGSVLFQEPATLPRISCLLMLVAGIIGLKLTTPAANAAQSLQKIDLFIGGYGEGIHLTTLDTQSATLGEPQLVAKLAASSFLAHHPRLPVLYSVSEVGGGAVVALRSERSPHAEAGLVFTEFARTSSGGNGPCHLSVHPGGKALFVANYGDGTVSMIPLNADGSFGERVFVDRHDGQGPDPKRQSRAYAHSIYPHPDGRHILSADLGCDAIFLYRVDFERGELAEKSSYALDPGSGPRHLAFSGDGRFVYCVNELSNTVTVLSWTDATLAAVQTIGTLPADFSATSYTAELRIHPTGNYLYVSNRGHDSLTTFAVDGASGTLTAIGYVPTGGSWPRGFEVDPSGQFLLVANQKSNLITLFRIDPQTGLPIPTDTTLALEKPACIRFAASSP